MFVCTRDWEERPISECSFFVVEIIIRGYHRGKWITADIE